MGLKLFDLILFELLCVVNSFPVNIRFVFRVVCIVFSFYFYNWNINKTLRLSDQSLNHFMQFFSIVHSFGNDDLQVAWNADFQ